MKNKQRTSSVVALTSLLILTISLSRFHISEVQAVPAEANDRTWRRARLDIR